MYVCMYISVICSFVHVIYIVNRMSQIGSHDMSSLDHVHYPVYEVSLCELSLCIYQFRSCDPTDYVT